MQVMFNSTPNFNGNLKVIGKKVPKNLEKAILKNEKLSEYAQSSKNDVVVIASQKIAEDSRNTHNKGDNLYKLYVMKESGCDFIDGLKLLFGFRVAKLAENYHTPSTIEDLILPNVSRKRLKKILG